MLGEYGLDELKSPVPEPRGVKDSRRMAMHRFSLRLLFFVIIALAAVCRQFSIAYRQSISVAELERLGCTVRYDADMASQKPWGSVHWFERDLFHNAVSVEDSVGRLREENLRALGRLPGLKHLYLAGDGITDEGLRALTGLRKLESVWLESTCTSDAGVRELRLLLPAGCTLQRAENAVEVRGVTEDPIHVDSFDIEVFDELTHRIVDEQYVIQTGMSNSGKVKVLWKAQISANDMREIKDRLGRIDWDRLRDAYRDPGVWDGIQVGFTISVNGLRHNVGLENVGHEGLLELCRTLNKMVPDELQISYPDAWDEERDDRESRSDEPSSINESQDDPFEL